VNRGGGGEGQEEGSEGNMNSRATSLLPESGEVWVRGEEEGERGVRGWQGVMGTGAAG
jgi:hypothetical protein